MLRLERHRLGPRVYLCGLRIHEFALGFAVLAVLLIGGVAEIWGLTHRTEVIGVFGTWLIGKDWRDLFPSKRNTASWSLLPHRVPGDPTPGSAPGEARTNRLGYPATDSSRSSSDLR